MKRLLSIFGLALLGLSTNVAAAGRGGGGGGGHFGGGGFSGSGGHFSGGRANSFHAAGPEFRSEEPHMGLRPEHGWAGGWNGGWHHQHGYFIYSDPFWFGGWWWGDSSPPPLYYEDSSIYPYAPLGATMPATPAGFYATGFGWGIDLQHRLVTWNEFVSFVRQQLLNVPAADRDEFRRGFGAADIGNGALFDQAWAAARS